MLIFINDLTGTLFKSIIPFLSTLKGIKFGFNSGVRAEVLLHLLEDSGIYVATGSACTSKSSAAHGSYVIKALGLNNKEIESAIRFSFSYQNTKEEKGIAFDKNVRYIYFASDNRHIPKTV